MGRERTAGESGEKPSLAASKVDKDMAREEVVAKQIWTTGSGGIAKRQATRQRKRVRFTVRAIAVPSKRFDCGGLERCLMMWRAPKRGRNGRVSEAERFIITGRKMGG